MKSKRTKACEIPASVKQRVFERDKKCVLCERFARDAGWSNAHFISRAHGGLGIEENIITLCPACHNRYDNSDARFALHDYFAEYLKSKYSDWDEMKLYYKKGD